MNVPLIPISAAVKKAALEKLHEVQALLKPSEVQITDAERKTLGSTAMGRESIPFAEEGQQLLASFPQIMPRTFTDEDLANYPTELEGFRDADDISVATETIMAQLNGIKLVTGNAVMRKARAGYKNGQLDNGKTPGVKPMIDGMSKRFPNGPKPVEPPTPTPVQ